MMGKTMEYVLTFNDQQMYIINMALGEIPHKFAAPLFQHINEQIAASLQGNTTEKVESELGTDA